MALTRTALQLESDARNRADQVGSTFRSSATVRRYLSESCRTLVTMLADKIGEDWFSETTTVSTTANQAYSDLPAGVYHLAKLRVTLDGIRDAIDRADVDDLDTEVTLQGWHGSQWPEHRVRGSKIYWYPTPTAVHTVTLEYVPVNIFKDGSNVATAQLSADADYFDGVFGWEEWAVLHTAIKLRNDNKQDTAGLERELGTLTRQILTASKQRVGTTPKRVRDTWRNKQRRFARDRSLR
jgi:hypothetical protein